MSFRTIAVITAIVALVLGTGWLLAGTLMAGRWQIESTESVLLMGRRIGAVYLGLSVMFFLAKSAPVSVARTALSTGTVLVCSLLAFLGLYEFSSGRAGPAILVSVAIELLFALGYARILATERRVANVG